MQESKLSSRKTEIPENSEIENLFWFSFLINTFSFLCITRLLKIKNIFHMVISRRKIRILQLSSAPRLTTIEKNHQNLDRADGWGLYFASFS